MKIESSGVVPRKIDDCAKFISLEENRIKTIHFMHLGNG